MIGRRSFLGSLIASAFAPALAKIAPVAPALCPMEIGYIYGFRFIKSELLPENTLVAKMPQEQEVSTYWYKVTGVNADGVESPSEYTEFVTLI